ncbi:MAG: hydrogenase [Armatimonadota bacterium]
MAISAQARQGHRLLQAGFVLFLLGLCVGFAVPALANPRMALASHLEGVLNGIFLIALGLVWPRLDLAPIACRIGCGLAVFGTFANVLATLLAAAWGAGKMMPIAAQGKVGSAAQEGTIQALLVALALAMVGVCVVVLFGLRNGPRDANP